MSSPIPQPDPPVGDCANPEQIRFWIEDCEENHGARCNEADHQAVVSISGMKFIDVVSLCIVSTPPQTRYFAISYVWGGVEQMQLTVENCLELSRPGSLQQCWNKIPATIQDAIRFTAALQERYLWVDRLCIVQNDSVLKHNQITQMGSIYNGAVACLVAGVGVDANSGLPGVRAQTRIPERRKLLYEDVYLIEPGPDEYTSLRRPQDNTPYTKQERRLRVRQLDLGDQLMKSIYDSRAWTYQERILSRRCIYFMDNMVYFHCRNAIRAENKATPYTQKTQDIRQLSLFKADPIFSGDMFFYSRTLGAIYTKLVEEFTRKHLTFPSDILKAFSGIGASMEKLCGWRFVAGLPEYLLDYALLWEPVQTLHQRRSEDSGGMFPSWSWAACATEVCHSSIFRTEANYEPYLADMQSLILETHIYDGKTARSIQGAVRPYSQLITALGTLPPTDIPKWLDRCSKTNFHGNMLIFRAGTMPFDDYKKIQTTVLSHSLVKPTNSGLTTTTTASQLERLSAIQTPNTEVVFLSVNKREGQEHENGWRFGRVLLNVMVIQWKGDFAERKAVLQSEVVMNEKLGNSINFRGGLEWPWDGGSVLRSIHCCWKTIPLI